ncbi:aminopeptidase [uncultured Tenacibaculum sp.]|uniref:aminopeptidase n=1 Tax=uncultured Tenacibaculum sp. TaxID=174713 RepID=UPI00261CE8D4|nr:aminopeptidase [uncultured Tenacibaculum sp.]
MKLHKSLITVFIFCLYCFSLTAQTNTIEIKAKLLEDKQRLFILQKTVFYNNSKDTLTNIFLHNWANSFKNNDTPLGKRFMEDYRMNFYFSKEEDRGYSEINNLTVNYEPTSFKEVKNKPDILEVLLNKKLYPKDSVVISTSYVVKIPNANFTSYGKTKNGYHLRFWYLTPAVYDGDWNTMSNLNMDDLFQEPTNYKIEIDIPENLSLESNLYQYHTKKEGINSYYLIGTEKKDIILSINTPSRFFSFRTHNKEIKTDAFNGKLSKKEITAIIDQQLKFIENYLGKNPHTEFFIDSRTVNKNSLRELYGLPSWLKPFPKAFRWEVSFFKALTKKYIDDALNFNRRKDYWFADGLETFLMMEYMKKYYPDITILGKYSKYWPIKTYNLAQLKQNDKYPFIYQFSARKFFDQPLNTRADSLSNFNRKVVSKYKAGLGFKYLQGFIGDSIFRKTLKQFYQQENFKTTYSNLFTDILQENTSKNLDWFINDYVKTDKKIDYKIKKVRFSKNRDSLLVTIKNKRNVTAPIALYGIQKKNIVTKTWIPGIDSTKTVKIKLGSFNKLALNYEQIYPEHNFLDNFRNVNNSIISKPLQLRFFKDVENPYYNQIFYFPDFKYNLYDGLIMGVTFNNQPIITRNFEFRITPTYSTKSQNFTGSYLFAYNHFFEKSKIYKIRYGISGSNFHYAPELGYNTFYPFITLQFRRNTLRDVGSQFILGRLVYVNKEVAPNTPKTDRDNYKIFNLRYIHSKPNVIHRLQYAVNAEFATNFSKLSTDIRYRQFFDLQRSFDVRFFGGVFTHNNTEGDYFSFGLNRGTDYLFEQNLFGRSESSGIFSQQFVVADGGFKSNFDKPYFANQFIASVNTSVSIWKWAEVYNDFALLKNRGDNAKFFYENGIRLNFVPNIFEFYFPIYTNQGFDITKEAYPAKIKFIITTNLDQIYNFIRRGIL